MVLDVARQRSGLTLRELGEWVGGIDYGAVAAAVTGFGERLEKEKTLAAMLKRVIGKI
jgi:hypothetical protein